jgi:uncharacterized repeat protein (TIGR03803 family)
MHCVSSVRHQAQSLAALSFLVCASAAYGADTYAGGVLQIPALGIGSAIFSNVELTVNLPLVRAPSGSMAVGTEDAYDPANNQLTVPAVKVGNSTFYNAVATVDRLTSIGSVSGADTFDGTNLILRNVQVGAQSYHDVTLHVGLANVARLGGGMPSVAIDQYDAATGQLTIGAVQVGAKVYTNVILNVGLSDVASVAGYAERVLYSFQGGTDGNEPVGSLILDASGNLYGTTSGVGGSGVFGTVFELTPNGSGGYTESVLHSFTSYPNDGGNPLAGVVSDANGNLYGTTSSGGSASAGAVFELTRNGSGGYTESVLYSFPLATADAWYPRAGLVVDANGNLYGTSYYGGSGNPSSGTVFQLTPNGSGGYTESVLYSFCSQTNCADGGSPLASLILDANGNLYGTTNLGGGASATGTVFKLTKGNGGYTLSVLYSFTDGTDGGNPSAGLVLDASGNLYGTTSGGGSLNAGTVFKLTANGNGGYTESVLHSFGGENDGADPLAGVILDANGNLYGTAEIAGSADAGIVFELSPNGDGGYSENVLYNFLRDPDGNEPEASLIMDPSGNLFGTTSEGGSTNNGVVFEIH